MKEVIIPNIHQVTSLFLRKAKSKPYLKTTWRTLKEAETMWLENIVVAKYSDKVRQELIEKPTVRLVSSPDTQSPRKERKTYSNCSENWKIRTVTQLLKRICSDKQLEEDVLSQLQRGLKREPHRSRRIRQMRYVSTLILAVSTVLMVLTCQ